MSIIIEKLDGTRYDLKRFGLNPLTFTVDSPTPRHVSEVVDGRSGYLDLGTTLEGRTMKATFYIKAMDKYDYPLARDEIYRLFDARTFFYLIDKHQPHKRWKVKTAEMFSPERFNGRIGTLEISFVSPSPFAESRGTTLDPLTFDAEKWQVGQGLTLEENGHPKYVHSTAVFMYYNAGDVAIDPRELPLKITYRGASNKLKITNSTNGDVWQHNGSSLANDTITLDGIQSFKNGLTIFGQTNRKLITIDPGWNLFTLTGYVGAFLISFEHRFYYF